ncbi:putative protein gravitropic in the light 1 [Helianthus annuus]|nr:putative protein gravitropic in the light 1 [Helianthus annuus]
MANKVTNFSDLIQRVTSSCLLHPIGTPRHYTNDVTDDDSDSDTKSEKFYDDGELDDVAPEEGRTGVCKSERETEMETLLNEVFETVSFMKKAYVSLQQAHCPWDPDKMRSADVAVVAEMKKLGVLRERFRRRVLRGGGGGGGERVVAGVSPSPMPEHFESCISSVKEGSKSFTSLLLSLMKSAHWDIAATVRSIEASTTSTPTATADSIVGPNHAKYALESYVNRKIFQGFDHETFYMDGSLSSLLNPDQFRTECFTQYRDMKAMDPIELLGVLPTCQFGKFCSKKYISIVHPKMEESLFGDLEQRRQVLAGNHPRTRFYGEFLVLAKAVWLLHLVAFSLDPPPTHFEGSRGAEFDSRYMESVVRFPGGRVAAGHVVGFPVSPGFKLGDGSVVKARVYVVPRSEL